MKLSLLILTVAMSMAMVLGDIRRNEKMTNNEEAQLTAVIESLLQSASVGQSSLSICVNISLLYEIT